MTQERRTKPKNDFLASHSTILSNQKIEWFKDRGITFNHPVDNELNNAVIDFRFKEKRSFDLRIQGDKEKFNAGDLFKAEFSPDRNPYSWHSMAHFLKLLYDPSTCVQKLSMYAFDKKLKDVLFSGEDMRYIRCGSFTLQMAYNPSSEDFCESLSWLEQNVQADKIEIPTFLDYEDEEICDAMSNFLLGPSWISASQEVDLVHVNELSYFYQSLKKKFQTLAAVQSTFPTIMLSGVVFFDTTATIALEKLLSGKEELDDSEDKEGWEFSEDEKKGKTYTISNGTKQMQIEFKEPPPRIFSGHSFGANIQSSVFDIRVTVVSSF